MFPGHMVTASLVMHACEGLEVLKKQANSYMVLTGPIEGAVGCGHAAIG